VTAIKIALSTASVFPERTPDAFETAARLGYDGLEVMVTADPVSQDAALLRKLSDYHSIPVVAVHAPNLLITQRVWSRDPWTKLAKSRDLAEALGARVVVVHPPFRWQRGLRGREPLPAAARRDRDRGLRTALESGRDGLGRRHA
jgi:sugar phosphate isomerase/epimerase